MRLDDVPESSNVEDDGGAGGGGGGGGFGFGGLPIGGGGLGIGGIIIVGILALVFGINPLTLLGGGGGGSQVQVGQPQIGQPQDQISQPAGGTPRPEDASHKFVAKVLATTEDTWGKLLPEQTGVQYEAPKLHRFYGQVQTGCGGASAASGPFYCPADRKVYLDTSFFDELSQRFGAPGDFAKAYVIAHEIGHHVQNLLGISDKVTAAQERVSRSQSNALSVRLELQADCLAGVWGKANAAILDPGDVEQALTAATAIGDDRLQQQAQGTVVPDSFTHGTSAERVRWLKRGLDSGLVSSCDTFGASAL